MKFAFGKKGFLFTISIIMFASTLIFFAQSYASVNRLNETAIISSAKPQNFLLLNDSIAFDLERIFGVSLDANEGSVSALSVSGTLSSSPGINAAVSSYESFLNGKLFPLISGSKSIDLDSLKDGKAEAYFGGAFEFDYNYAASSVALFPLKSSALSRIDINIRSFKDLNNVSWVSGPVGGEVPVYFNYFDDSNQFSISPQLIDPNSLSSLVLNYGDSNVSIDFGKANDGVDSSVGIFDPSGQRIDYSVNLTYGDENVFPIFWNSRLVYLDGGLDGNSMITIRR